jgi:hypothetical protein
MAHYAFLDENNIVTEVIVGKDEGEDDIDWEQHYGAFRGQPCKRTSYNGNYRKNYAGMGYSYNADLDAFIAPKPYSSWVLDEETAQWGAPTPYPTDGLTYAWNEPELAWQVVDFSETPAE